MEEDLREIMKTKSYAEIMFVDGESAVGFVTLVANERFHLVSMDVIPPKASSENSFHDEEGNIHIKVDPEQLEYVLVKQSFVTDMVASITFDVSHRVDEKMWKSLSFMRDNSIFGKKVKPTTKKPKEIVIPEPNAP